VLISIISGLKKHPFIRLKPINLNFIGQFWKKNIDTLKSDLEMSRIFFVTNAYLSQLIKN
jgi:hypothetical protein